MFAFLKLLTNKLNLFYFLFPMISGFITAAICPMGGDTGSAVKFRPPGFVFGIVWPILYIMLGAAWVLSKNRALIYLLLTLSLCAWIVTYSCLGNKKVAAWVLLINLMLSILTLVVSQKISQVLLTPLVCWLLFALIMNTTDVQLSL